MSQEPDAPRPDAGPPPGWPTPSVRAPSKTLPGEPVFPSLSGAPTDPGADPFSAHAAEKLDPFSAHAAEKLDPFSAHAAEKLDPFSAHAAENMAFALSQAPPIVAPAGKDGTTVMPAAQSTPKAGTEILLVGNAPGLGAAAPLPITAQDAALGSTEQATPLGLAEAGAIPFVGADAPRMTEAGLPPNFMMPGAGGEPAPIVVGFDGPSATAPGGAPPMAMGPDLGAVVGPPVVYGASYGSSSPKRGSSLILVGLLSALGIAGVATAGVLIHRQQKAASRPDEAPAPTIELPSTTATAVVGAAPPVTDLAEPPPVQPVDPPPSETTEPTATAAPATGAPTAAPTAKPTSTAAPTAKPTSTSAPTAKPTGTGTSPTAKPTGTSTSKPPTTSTKPPSGPIVMKPPGTKPPPSTTGGYKPPPSTTGGYKPPPSTTGGYKPPPSTTGGYKPPKKPIIVMKEGGN
jgi:hypothetical protein